MTGHDKLGEISLMFTMLTKQFQEKSYIGQKVSVDEMMVKGKTQ